jgi:L-fuconate dehydratase
VRIQKIRTRDARFQLEAGAGSDAIHSAPEYSFAVTELISDSGLKGSGLVLTMGEGNDLVCHAIEMLAAELAMRDVEELMAGFGDTFRKLADPPKLRWLGPHKGVVHLALASITNACFDLWAKSRREPLWSTLLSLSPVQFANLLDLSYLEDVLDEQEVIRLVENHSADREARSAVLKEGYPGYDTRVGWYHYDDARIRENVRRSVDQGFSAFKLKVGGSLDQDVRRAQFLREFAGAEATIMLDANQQWTLPGARLACAELAAMQPYWIEEPTHPDDIFSWQKRSHPFPWRLASTFPIVLSSRIIWKLAAWTFSSPIARGWVG